MQFPKRFTDRWNLPEGFFSEIKQLRGLVHIIIQAGERLFTAQWEGETPKKWILKYTKAKLRA